MKAVMSRLKLQSRASFPRLCSLVVLKNGRSLSISSDKVDGAPKVQEVETVKTPPMEKLLVLGGNGFVGSHVCREALGHGLTVSSLSRRFAFTRFLKACTKWSNLCGVKRFIYISAADFGLINYLLRGYYEGKRSTEAELMKNFPRGGVFLRPGFVHGTRRVGNVKLPLSIVGAPLEMVLQHAKLLTRIPLIGPLFIPPVHVSSVAKVAVRAATDPAFPPGILDVYSILQRSR
ncbi:uncharacterized protein At1g32220, chloroplastic isoform X2 [Manihot esculenta]|uniref:uncharacterized protein At1g32220, chloroplastic isoform X2 n=1 Tax=Manihot esculenta TaxID=3983 RepID=UPI001CC3D9B6|nr:uncharacterized protein At1g32220, chloroplastic isoform X2 [Manihot esculenta]